MRLINSSHDDRIVLSLDKSFPPGWSDAIDRLVDAAIDQAVRVTTSRQDKGDEAIHEILQHAEALLQRALDILRDRRFPKEYFGVD